MTITCSTPERSTMPSFFCLSICPDRCTWSSPSARILCYPGPLPSSGLSSLSGAPLICAPPRRGRRLSQPSDNLNADSGRDRRAGNSHRTMDRRPGDGGDTEAHPDAAGFIKSFTGSDRSVLDYLAEEVLHQKPAKRAEVPAANIDP